MIDIKKQKTKKLLYYLIALFMIVFNSNTLVTQIVVSTRLSALIVFAFCLLVFLFSDIRKNTEIQKSTLFAVVLLPVAIILSMLVNFDFSNINGYIIIVMKIIGAFFMLVSCDREMFFESFYKVMVVLSVASLVATYPLSALIPDQYFPVVTNRVGIQFYYMLFSFKIKSYGAFALRNYGIFSEPAVYCFYLFLATLFSFYKKDFTSKDIISVAVLAVTMVTTFSPIGLITAICTYFILANRIIFSEHKKPLKYTVLIVGALAILLFVYNTTLNNGMALIEEKATLGSGDGAGRVQSIINNYIEGLKTPIFGGGLVAITDQTFEMGYNTTTTGASFLGFGIIFMVFLIVLQIKSVLYFTNKNNIMFKVLMMVLFFLQINNHGYIQSDWFWIITLAGLGGITNNETDYSNLQPGNP